MNNREANSTSTGTRRTAPSKRLARLPPYPFAELERKIRAKEQSGVDVISLGIGDPDKPTPDAIVEEMCRQVQLPDTQHYPTNLGREEFRRAVASFYDRRFGVGVNPDTQIVPVLGAKECIFHLNAAFLDPDDVVLAADPGYPGYTAGPSLAGAEPVLMPLTPENDFMPDLGAVTAEACRRARLLFINYPNNPTGAVAREGFFRELVDFALKNDVLVVHDNAYSETTFDGYVAPSFLATEGAFDVGVEIYSLSKGFNMTGWRCGAIVGNAQAIEQYWRLKTNVDSGMFEAIQMAAVRALSQDMQGPVDRMREIYTSRRDLVVDVLSRIGIEVTPPRGAIYVWAPVPDGQTSTSFAEHVLDKAAVVVSPGSMYGPGGEGYFRISLSLPEDRLREAVNRIGKNL